MNLWEIVKIDEELYGKSIPYVSIGHNRMAFNKAAYDLIDGRRNGYTVAQFLTSPYNPDVIGVRFWKQQYEDSLGHCVPLIQKESKDGKPIGGVDIANSRFLETLFGSVVSNNTVTRYRVRRDDDCAHILVIDKQSTIDN